MTTTDTTFTIPTRDELEAMTTSEVRDHAEAAVAYRDKVVKDFGTGAAVVSPEELDRVRSHAEYASIYARNREARDIIATRQTLDQQGKELAEEATEARQEADVTLAGLEDAIREAVEAYVEAGLETWRDRDERNRELAALRQQAVEAGIEYESIDGLREAGKAIGKAGSLLHPPLRAVLDPFKGRESELLPEGRDRHDVTALEQFVDRPGAPSGTRPGPSDV